jgi:hypothetical protein
MKGQPPRNNEVTTALMARLREIVSREPWDQGDLAEWANEFLYCFEVDEDEGRWREAGARQERQVQQRKPLVGPYRPDPRSPALPDRPDGQLHGIGFIYDEDRDDRVLVAIDKLRADPGLVAVAEHEGCLWVYSRLPLGLNSVVVCGDQWAVAEFVPHLGRWVEVTPEFLKDCVARVVGRHGKPWQSDPPTAKQVAYVLALGYGGPDPQTKGEAGALIAGYEAKKGSG